MRSGSERRRTQRTVGRRLPPKRAKRVGCRSPFTRKPAVNWVLVPPQEKKLHSEKNMVKAQQSLTNACSTRIVTWKDCFQQRKGKCSDKHSHRWEFQQSEHKRFPEDHTAKPGSQSEARLVYSIGHGRYKPKYLLH